MPLAKCPRCSKLFDKVDTRVCPSCQVDEDADHEKVSQVLEDNPGLNAEQLAEASGVEVACVLRMVGEGHLTSAERKEGIKCGRCGAPAISLSKKLCQACLDKLNAEVAKAQANIKLPGKRNAQIGEYLPSTRQSLEEKRRI